MTIWLCISTGTKSFEVFIPLRKVVLEDYTGTWCGYCPSVAAAIVDAHAATNYISVIAIHETASSNPDPFHFPQVDLLKAEVGVTGLPAARIDRTTIWSDPYAVGEVTAIAGEETNVSIAINSQLSGDVLNAEVRVIYEEGSLPGDKLVFYLTEDGLIYDQTNYFQKKYGISWFYRWIKDVKERNNMGRLEPTCIEIDKEYQALKK